MTSIKAEKILYQLACSEALKCGSHTTDLASFTLATSWKDFLIAFKSTVKWWWTVFVIERKKTNNCMPVTIAWWQFLSYIGLYMRCEVLTAVKIMMMSMCLGNDWIYLRVHTESQPKRVTSSSSQQCEAQISQIFKQFTWHNVLEIVERKKVNKLSTCEGSEFRSKWDKNNGIFSFDLHAFSLAEVTVWRIPNL